MTRCAELQSPGFAVKGKFHLVLKTYLCCLEQMQLQIALECSASSAPTSIINVFYEDFCVLVIKRCRLHAPSMMLFVWSRKVWEENSFLKSFGIPGPQIRLLETRRLLGAVSKQPSGVKRICFQLMYKGISVQRALQNSRDQLPCITCTFIHDITPGKHFTAANDGSLTRSPRQTCTFSTAGLHEHALCWPAAFLFLMHFT